MEILITKWNDMKKLALAAAAFAAMNFAHASVFTMNATGTVVHGMDGQGLFSAVGTKLDGLPFSMTVTLELDGTALYTSNTQGFSKVTTTTPFIVALTVGDYDYAYRVTDNPRSSAVLNVFGFNGGAQFRAFGSDALGRQILNTLSFSTSQLNSSSLTQYAQVSGGAPNTQWGVGTGPNASYFTADRSPQIFTINGTPATLPEPTPDPIPVSDPPPTSDPRPVPEPASAMLFGLGLLGLVVRRCWRTR